MAKRRVLGRAPSVKQPVRATFHTAGPVMAAVDKVADKEKRSRSAMVTILLEEALAARGVKIALAIAFVLTLQGCTMLKALDRYPLTRQIPDGQGGYNVVPAGTP